MGHTFVLLTASLLAAHGQGQVISSTPEPGCNCNNGSGSRTITTSSSSSNVGFFDRMRGPRSSGGVVYEESPRPGLFAGMRGKIGSFFGRPSNEPTVFEGGTSEIGVPVSEPAPEVGQRMPNKISYTEPPLNGGAPVANNIPITNRQDTTPMGDSGVAQVSFRPTAAAAPAAIAGKAAHALLPQFVDKVGHEEDYSWITGQLGQEGNRWIIIFATADTVDRFHGKLLLAGSADMSNFQVGDLVSIQGGTINHPSGAAYLIETINLVEHK